jgi:RNA polymerase sigma factor (sigma-70 family)
MMKPIQALSQLTAAAPLVSWDDERLVEACLKGDERAWASLIHKYKNLIYSIPMKYGASREDAADIFQGVCLELFAELSNLRKIGALRSWLITVAAHKSFHWKRKQRYRQAKEVQDSAEGDLEGNVTVAPEMLEQLEREQTVREGIARLPSRCAELVRMLFYEDPPTPYAEVAQKLGLALGSIGFIRGRCLKQLEKILGEMGF